MTDEQIDEIALAVVYDGDTSIPYREEWCEVTGRPFARAVIAAHEQAQPEDLLALRKDAQRYRWLREQNWHDGPLTVVRSPREAVRLGYDCPSLSRLDEFIDEFRAALAGAGESK